jgi:hypothetical protein
MFSAAAAFLPQHVSDKMTHSKRNIEVLIAVIPIVVHR